MVKYNHKVEIYHRPPEREENKYMVNIRVDEDTIISLLMERLEYWTQDKETLDLFEQMYTSYVENGCFDGGEFDPMVIVDNDWVNWCEVIGKDDKNWDKLVKLYEEGNRDVSCDGVGYSFVEAYDPYNELMLVRW